MTENRTAALHAVQGQLAALESIWTEASTNLNTVAGSERVEKWKKQTVQVLAQHVNQDEAKRFSETHPGPSFTNDLVEEFSDHVDVYRTWLTQLADRLKKMG